MQAGEREGGYRARGERKGDVGWVDDQQEGIKDGPEMRNKQEESTTRKIGRHEMFKEVRRKGERRLRWKSVRQDGRSGLRKGGAKSGRRLSRREVEGRRGRE